MTDGEFQGLCVVLVMNRNRLRSAFEETPRQLNVRFVQNLESSLKLALGAGVAFDRQPDKFGVEDASEFDQFLRDIVNELRGFFAAACKRLKVASPGRFTSDRWEAMAAEANGDRWRDSWGDLMDSALANAGLNSSLQDSFTLHSPFVESVLRSVEHVKERPTGQHAEESIGQEFYPNALARKIGCNAKTLATYAVSHAGLKARSQGEKDQPYSAIEVAAICAAFIKHSRTGKHKAGAEEVRQAVTGTETGKP